MAHAIVKYYSPFYLGRYRHTSNADTQSPEGDGHTKVARFHQPTKKSSKQPKDSKAFIRLSMLRKHLATSFPCLGALVASCISEDGTVGCRPTPAHRAHGPGTPQLIFQCHASESP
jgi:hypothetical protein